MIDWVYCDMDCKNKHLSNVGWEILKKEHPEKVDLCNWFINKEYERIN